jgi:hypothetical protein
MYRTRHDLSWKSQHNQVLDVIREMILIYLSAMEVERKGHGEVVTVVFSANWEFSKVTPICLQA